MKRFLIAVAAAALSSTIGFAQGVHRHMDERTGTSALVPSHWQSSVRDPDWEGVRLFSGDGESWLAIWGKSSAGYTVRGYQRLVADAAGDRVTYSARGRNWFVVSGFNGGRIFYVKAIRRCGPNEWHHIAFEYPVKRKRAFDALVTAVSRSLSAHCGRHQPSLQTRTIPRP